ncbi:MAG: DUF1573 domain-containing protein [Bacteroidales bacterium]|nr:DUF1573 domain-containing protein [Bacteroidales bacterium]
MLRTLAIIVLLSFLSMLSVAQTKGAGARFDAYEFDFGQILEKDGPVSHVFTLVNSSSESISITRAIPGCSCITATFPKEKIAPGKTAEVEVFFSPGGASGNIYRTIDIVSSSGRGLGTLGIKAHVTPSDLSIQGRYPSSLSEMIYVSRTKVPFGYMSHGQSQTKVIFLANASDRTVSLSISTLGSGFATVEYPETLAPLDEVPVQITYSMPEDRNLFSQYEDFLEVEIDGKVLPKTISVSSILVNKAPASKDAPSLRTYPSVGSLKKGFFSSTYSGSITVSNDGKVPLQIHECRLVSGQGKVTPGGKMTIQPGKSVSISVEGCPDEAKVEIYTNDPSRPFKELIFKSSTK